MDQPYGKTRLPSDWQRNFLRSITSFNLQQLKIFTGIRIGIFIIALLAIGLLYNYKINIKYRRKFDVSFF